MRESYLRARNEAAEAERQPRDSTVSTSSYASNSQAPSAFNVRYTVVLVRVYKTKSLVL